MRILMVLDHPYPSDIRVENEARSLVEAGHEVGLLQIAPDTRPETDSHEGVRVFRNRVSRRQGNLLRGTAGMIPWMDWHLGREVEKVARDWPFDALHVHDLYLVGGGIRVARRLGVPLVADLHENWVDALQRYAWSTRAPGKFVVSIPRWRRIEQEWVQAADHIIVPIEEAAERYIELGVSSERVHVVPNTIDLSVFDAFPIEDALVEELQAAYSLVYTGGIDIHRGLETVVEAMPAILQTRPDARLVIVGDGRTRVDLESRVGDLGLTDATTFYGFQPQARIKSFLAGAAISLIPHLKTPHTDHTIPHKLFHSMHVGTPVLASNCDPLKRIVTEVDCGMVFRSGSPESFAAAVASLAEDSNARAAMGRRGREAVKERYNWDATARPLLELYASLTDV